LEPKVDNKVGISLSLILAHEDECLSAIASLRERLLALQSKRDEA
jgi:hypothetical protein